MPDTEKVPVAEITAVEAAVEQAIIEGKQKLKRLSARLADLKHRLARFEPSSRQQKETSR